MAGTAIKSGVNAYIVDGLEEKRVQPIIDVAIARFREFQVLEFSKTSDGYINNWLHSFLFKAVNNISINARFNCCSSHMFLRALCKHYNRLWLSFVDIPKVSKNSLIWYVCINNDNVSMSNFITISKVFTFL